MFYMPCSTNASPVLGLLIPKMLKEDDMCG